MSIKLKLYKKIYLIRKTEETIQKYYCENEMKTPMHMSLGEEAIVAGVCEVLNKEDQVFGTHRSHALYLAKTEEIDLFFAELYGKETGFAKGKSGSMHLSCPKYGFMGSSAIVGGNFAMAVGAAFANKYKNNNKVVVVFFGDGAIDEGSFWESMNIACLMELPIIFVCEDNGLAVYTNDGKRHGYKSISNIISKFNCNIVKSESTDTEEIYNITKNIIEKMKKNNQPSFMHLKYYRYLDHVGVNEDFDLLYRNKKEFNDWIERDPIKILRNKLLIEINENLIIQVEKEINDKISNSIKIAKKSLICDIKELYKDVFCE